MIILVGFAIFVVGGTLGFLIGCAFSLSSRLDIMDELDDARAEIASSSEVWLQAQRRLAEIHQQHVEAGKKAHARTKARRAARTDDLRRCIAARVQGDGSAA